MFSEKLIPVISGESGIKHSLVNEPMSTKTLGEFQFDADWTGGGAGYRLFQIDLKNLKI